MQTGVLRRCRGQCEKAEEPLLKGLLLWCEIGSPVHCAHCLAELTTIARERHQMSRSARMFGVTDQVWTLTYLRPYSVCPDFKKPVQAAYREMKQAEAYSEARAHADGLLLAEAICYAFDVPYISRICG